MKNRVIYLILAVTALVAIRSLGLGGPSQDMQLSRAMAYAIGVVVDIRDMPCEEASAVQIVVPNNISVSVNDACMDDPFAENRKIEQDVCYHICRVETFTASKSLSQLHRLNI